MFWDEDAREFFVPRFPAAEARELLALLTYVKYRSLLSTTHRKRPPITADSFPL